MKQKPKAFRSGVEVKSIPASSGEGKSKDTPRGNVLLLPPENLKAKCPTCKLNPIVEPFDYCIICEMLGIYYQNEIWRSEEKWDFESWRRKQTFKSVEALRVGYWEK